MITRHIAVWIQAMHKRDVQILNRFAHSIGLEEDIRQVGGVKSSENRSSAGICCLVGPG